MELPPAGSQALLEVVRGVGPWTALWTARTPSLDHARVGVPLRSWPYALAALGGLGLLVGVGLAFGRSPAQTATPAGTLLWLAFAVLPTYALAVFLLRRAPTHPTTRWLVLMSGSAGIGMGVEGAVRYAVGTVGAGPWLAAANLAHQYTNVGIVIGSAGLVAFFPAGVPDRRWQAWSLGAGAAGLVLVPLGLALATPAVVIDPFLLDPPPQLANPVAVAALAPFAGTLTALYAAFHGLVLLAFAVLALRYRRATPAVRAPMLPLLLAVLAGLLVALLDLAVRLSGATPPRLLGALFAVASVLIAASVLWGVLRHRLFGIRLAARRSAVYGALTLGIAAVYAAVVAVPGLALGSLIPVELAVLLTIGAALAFQPLRRRMDGLADRWAFGRRVDRSDLLMSLGATLEQTPALSELLPRLAATVRDGLGAAWVRVSLRGDEPGNEAGGEPGDRLGGRGVAGVPDGYAVLSVPLERAGEPIGRIECGPAPGGYGMRERELLAGLAAQAATAIANLRLTAQLARSRARIVAAADAERRRIERDIHDGVQQEVVALIAKLRLARNQVGRGERTADDVLAEATADARELLTDLRELAHGIHPPLLSDRGLVAAVEARADRLPVPTVVRAAPGMQSVRWDQQLEGASYFVICEALTNVVKHSGASAAEVELSAVDGTLRIEVGDDGHRRNGTAGQGVTNMRDRVEALGGRFQVLTDVSGGTRVRAELPIGDPDA